LRDIRDRGLRSRKRQEGRAATDDDRIAEHAQRVDEAASKEQEPG
jgi:hypothetical protein